MHDGADADVTRGKVDIRGCGAGAVRNGPCFPLGLEDSEPEHFVDGTYGCDFLRQSPTVSAEEHLFRSGTHWLSFDEELDDDDNLSLAAEAFADTEYFSGSPIFP